MGLSDFEPAFDVRFVEKKGSETRSTPIEKFPCVIGHQGNITPQILNGAISSKHCTISYSIEKMAYLVDDGAGGKASTNGIYFGDEGDSSRCDQATLTRLGQRVYLLRVIGGDEGYVELYDAKKDVYSGRSTMDMDPRLIRTEATATEAHTIATKNAEHIEQLEGKLKQFFIIYEVMTANPKRTMTGILLTFLILVLGTPFLVAWATRDAWTGAIIEQYKSHSQSK